ESDDVGHDRSAQVPSLEVRVAQTLAGLAAAADSVTASVLKRALLRKDPTFSESDHGFRSFGEVLRHLAERNVVELSEGRSEEHTSELQSRFDLVCRLLL